MMTKYIAKVFKFVSKWTPKVAIYSRAVGRSENPGMTVVIRWA